MSAKAAKEPTVTLLIVCPDQIGIVASLTSGIAKHGGSFFDVDFHTDHEENLFLGRLEWGLTSFNLPREEIRSTIDALCAPLNGRWELHFSDEKQRVALFVSLQDHCMLDLLKKSMLDEVNAEVALVIANHDTLKPEAEHYGVPFHLFKVTKANKAEQEAKELELLKSEKIDLVVMAKYMQIISDSFLEKFPNVINIHHSFLPAFVGAKPYHQAHARGVKLIGATAHFATAELDAGPIIEQEVVRVSHRDTVNDLVRKGKDVERIVLSRAVRLHLLHRVLTYGNKTVVFE